MSELTESKPAAAGGKLTLASVERFLMALSMAALCVLTMVNVLVRYFTDISFAFTEEISVALMVAMTLIGASHAFATNHHIAIAFFVEKRPAVRAFARRLAAFASLVMFALLVYYGTFMAWDDYDFEVTSPSLGIPQWIYTIWLPLLSLVIVLRLLVVLVRGNK